LRQHSDEIAKRGAEIVVLGPDKASAFEQRWKADSLPFLGLPDPEHSVLDLYGQQVKILKLGRMPAQALVDKDGVVRFVHYGSSMSDIPEPAEILRLLDVLNGEPPPLAMP
jgi:peroxiredoxin Q/BCP